MEIGTCALPCEDILAALASEKSIVLATAADGRVTTRIMSHVHDGMALYFQTGKDSLKAQQMRSNPHVAIHVAEYDMEGEATLLGHPLSEENSLFSALYREKHPQYTDLWSAYPDEIVVRVDIALVRKWRYIDGKPFIAIWQTPPR